jgi:hypothetical protein
VFYRGETLERENDQMTTDARSKTDARSDTLQAILAASLAAAALLLFSITSGCASTPERPLEPSRPTPSLVGHPRSEAEQRLTKAGLAGKFSYRYAEVDQEWVVDQTPESGVPIAPPAAVEVVVITRTPPR